MTSAKRRPTRGQQRLSFSRPRRPAGGLLNTLLVVETNATASWQRRTLRRGTKQCPDRCGRYGVQNATDLNQIGWGTGEPDAGDRPRPVRLN